MTFSNSLEAGGETCSLWWPGDGIAAEISWSEPPLGGFSQLGKKQFSFFLFFSCTLWWVGLPNTAVNSVLWMFPGGESWARCCLGWARGQWIMAKTLEQRTPGLSWRWGTWSWIHWNPQFLGLSPCRLRTGQVSDCETCSPCWEMGMAHLHCAWESWKVWWWHQTLTLTLRASWLCKTMGKTHTNQLWWKISEASL